MDTIVVILLASFLWFVSLLQGTGLGNSINITENAHYILEAISMVIILRRYKEWKVRVDFFISISIVLVSFIFLPYIFHGQLLGSGYLLVFLSTLILSTFKINERCIRWVAFIYGVLGIIFLVVYNQTNILAGWNENSIAMIGFFSYSVFLIGFMFSKRMKDIVLTVSVMVVYLYLLNITDSRSSMLFVALSILFVLNFIKLEKLNTKRISGIFLYIPLLVAIIGVIIPKLPFYEELNLWSYVKFKKPFLNGRNEIWLAGFKRLKRDMLFGSGTLVNGWHNSAIICLTSYGIVGYMSWIATFRHIVVYVKKYLQDRIIRAGFVVFLLVYLQQSVEIGIIATEPNYIPYVVLGILLGRTRLLKQYEISRGEG